MHVYTQWTSKKKHPDGAATITAVNLKGGIVTLSDETTFENHGKKAVVARVQSASRRFLCLFAFVPLLCRRKQQKLYTGVTYASSFVAGKLRKYRLIRNSFLSET